MDPQGNGTLTNAEDWYLRLAYQFDACAQRGGFTVAGSGRSDLGWTASVAACSVEIAETASSTLASILGPSREAGPLFSS